MKRPGTFEITRQCASLTKKKIIMSHSTYCHHCGSLQKDDSVTVRFKGVDSKGRVIHAVLSECNGVMIKPDGAVSDVTEAADSNDLMPCKFALEDLLNSGIRCLNHASPPGILESHASQENVAHLLGALLRHYMSRFDWQELTSAEISPFMAEQ